jgi:cytidylate kinase
MKIRLVATEGSFCYSSEYKRSTRRQSIPIVTIRGSLGSGAPEVGRQAADKLHFDYVDREIIAEVAARLHRQEQDVIAKEMPDGSLLSRIAEALGRSGECFEGAYLPAWEIRLDDTRYLASLESVVKELARSQSLVIRGRGSQFILKDYPGALHVLVVAPIEVRVKRVMENLGLDRETAKREIARFDNSRREFIKRYFHAELEDPAYYDIVINTQRLSLEAAASLVVNAVSFRDRA